MKNLIRVICIIPLLSIHVIVMLFLITYADYLFTTKRLKFAIACLKQSFKNGYSLLYCVSGTHYFFQACRNF